VNDYHLIKLEDRGGGLSRMHVRLDPHKGGAMVTDLGSTNGTMVATPGSRATELQPQVPHFAKEGDQLRLGNAIVCFLTAETAVSR
jgi:pSer/pThr/pTyr-binding forkhead associated (FHA) protein